mmetsp:Transcript_4566/g.4750  ORF Transcript_4566/g.4750 Transcript_4566/m.4750 type:complete len:89 (-) Transcript_4566:1541-1807(-)
MLGTEVVKETIKGKKEEGIRVEQSDLRSKVDPDIRELRTTGQEITTMITEPIKKEAIKEKIKTLEKKDLKDKIDLRIDLIINMEVEVE